MISRSAGYSLNTNGTLITPALARLLKARGTKMVAIYGSTAAVYDRVTRNPGGFEALLQGLAYLKEAGAGFMLQLVPMRENWGQWDDMVTFAQSWTPHYRLGAAWLHMSACGDPLRNRDIERQRLDPADVVELDTWVAPDDDAKRNFPRGAMSASPEEQLLASCVATRREFHVDPYGGMSFCDAIKDPALRYESEGRPSECSSKRFATDDPRRRRAPCMGGVHTLAGRECARGLEYAEGCGACGLRADCRWCDAYGYLEHRRDGAKVEYLCEVAGRTREFKEGWMQDHCRYYGVGGITIRVESDLPFSDTTFHEKIEQFRVDGPGSDLVSIHHRFGLPEGSNDLGTPVYSKPPWVIQEGPFLDLRDGVDVWQGSPTACHRSFQRRSLARRDLQRSGARAMVA